MRRAGASSAADDDDDDFYSGGSGVAAEQQRLLVREQDDTIRQLGASVERYYLKSPSAFVLNRVALATLKVPLGHVGLALTTLTSALSYLLGAPRVLQAIARDSGWAPLQQLLEWEL